MQSCQMGCVQGDGSHQQTSLYHVCMYRCVHPEANTYVPPEYATNPLVSFSSTSTSSGSATAATGAPPAAAAATTNTNTNTTPAVVSSSTVIGAATAGSSSSKSSSSVSTTASSKPTIVETSDAADLVRFGTSGLGLAGLVVALFM